MSSKCVFCYGFGTVIYANIKGNIEFPCTKCNGTGKIGGQMSEQKETVNHPQHYNMGKFEVIDVIEDWRLGFNDGNAVKYISRHRYKANPKEDLKKALWYITRELYTGHGVTMTEITAMVATVVKEKKHGTNS